MASGTQGLNSSEQEIETEKKWPDNISLKEDSEDSDDSFDRKRALFRAAIVGDRPSKSLPTQKSKKKRSGVSKKRERDPLTATRRNPERVARHSAPPPTSTGTRSSLPQSVGSFPPLDQLGPEDAKTWLKVVEICAKPIKSVLHTEVPCEDPAAIPKAAKLMFETICKFPGVPSIAYLMDAPEVVSFLVVWDISYIKQDFIVSLFMQDVQRRVQLLKILGQVWADDVFRDLVSAEERLLSESLADYFRAFSKNVPTISAA